MDKLPPSPKMKQIFANPDITRARKHSLDFDSLAVYDTFTVGMNTIKVSVLRTTAVRAGQRLGRKFRVVTHTADNLYEVGRLPDPVAKPKAEVIKEPEPEKYYPGYQAPVQTTEDFDITKYKPLPTSKNYGLLPSIPTPPELTAADLAFARSLDDDDILEGETEEQYNARMDAKMGIVKPSVKFFND